MFFQSINQLSNQLRITYQKQIKIKVYIFISLFIGSINYQSIERTLQNQYNMISEDMPQVQKYQALIVEDKHDESKAQTEKIDEKQDGQKIVPRERILSKTILLSIAIALIIFELVYLASNLHIHNQSMRCPQNATCSLFLSCDGGYEFIREQYSCRISLKAKQQAFKIVKQTIQQLSYEYGERNCDTLYSNQQYHKDKKLIIPTRRILSLSIQQPGVQKFFFQIIQQAYIQKDFGFSINHRNQIVPLKIKISNSCLIKKTYENHQLQFVFICIFILAILLLACYGIYHCRCLKIKENSIRIGQFIFKMFTKIKNFFANTFKNKCKNSFNLMKNKTSEKWTKLREKIKKMQKNQFVFMKMNENLL